MRGIGLKNIESCNTDNFINLALMYKAVLRPLLFLFDPEYVHRFIFRFLKIFFSIPFAKKGISRYYQSNNKRLPKALMGIQFKNPVGLAAGFDKDAKLTGELSVFGFGFIEIGTVTPKPQPGNEKPRMFRLTRDKALINRMGFNNEGADAAARRLRKKNSGVIIGGNIGKNKNTPNELAIADYEFCFHALYECVDYFAVNVSSPNTPGLRALQEREPLTALLNHLQQLNQQKKKPKPILLKIAPDLTNEQLTDVASIVRATKLAGIIATNTTISRYGLKSNQHLISETGGLSGQPLKQRSTEAISYLRNICEKNMVIIGSGGIFTVEDAREKLAAGADLIQVYTGFIYEGPSIVKRICKGLLPD